MAYVKTYLWFFSGISQSYLKHISDLSQVYLRYHAHDRHISGILQTYLRQILRIAEAYIRMISNLSQVYLRQMSTISQDISQEYYHAYYRKLSRAALRHISVMSTAVCDIFRYIMGISQHISSMIQTTKCLLSHEIFLLNFIYCDTSFLFMDTEIFAAYAGSCLFVFFHFLICDLFS